MKRSLTSVPLGDERGRGRVELLTLSRCEEVECATAGEHGQCNRHGPDDRRTFPHVDPYRHGRPDGEGQPRPPQAQYGPGPATIAAS